MMEMHGHRYLSVLRFIGELHNSFREALCRNEPQCGVFALPEELSPLPYNERMDREIDHVEYVVLQQRLSQKTMAVDEDIPSFLLLELGHFSTTSPRTMVELFHSAFSSFDEKTYFCMASNCRPTGGFFRAKSSQSFLCVAAHQHRVARQQ